MHLDSIMYRRAYVILNQRKLFICNLGVREEIGFATIAAYFPSRAIGLNTSRDRILGKSVDINERLIEILGIKIYLSCSISLSFIFICY